MLSLMLQTKRELLGFSLSNWGYEFTPLYGEATFGFGEAYTLDTKDMDRLIPRSGMGHQK